MPRLPLKPPPRRRHSEPLHATSPCSALLRPALLRSKPLRPALRSALLRQVLRSALLRQVPLRQAPFSLASSKPPLQNLDSLNHCSAWSNANDFLICSTRRLGFGQPATKNLIFRGQKRVFFTRFVFVFAKPLTKTSRSDPFIEGPPSKLGISLLTDQKRLIDTAFLGNPLHLATARHYGSPQLPRPALDHRCDPPLATATVMGHHRVPQPAPDHCGPGKLPQATMDCRSHHEPPSATATRPRPLLATAGRRDPSWPASMGSAGDTGQRSGRLAWVRRLRGLSVTVNRPASLLFHALHPPTRVDAAPRYLLTCTSYHASA